MPRPLPPFESRVRKVSGACWVWTGPRAGKHGCHGKRYAHRIAYEQAYGPIPEGHDIHHVCENKLCVNPEHLEAWPRADHPGTIHAENRAKTHCVNGHPFTRENTYTRRRGDGRTSRQCRECVRDRTRRLSRAEV